MDLSAPLGFSKINYSFNDLTYTCGNGEDDGENAVVPMTVLKMVAGWLTKHIDSFLRHVCPRVFLPLSSV